MARVSETKACRSCAVAKRRCGKQIPHCLRCRTRGIECTYPAAKPSSFVLCSQDTLSFAAESSPDWDTSLQLSANSPRTSGAGDARLSLALGLDLPGYFGPLLDDQFDSSWFASLEAWQVRLPTAAQNPSFISNLKDFITTIFQWLAEWVEKGGNSFIHTALYRTRFPRCVQDAYTALTCYLHKTAANEQIAFRIIEDRVKNLIAEYSNSLQDASSDTRPSTPLDPLEHIARVHALLIYQIIGLFNGDIRLRYLAETYIPVLNSWMQEMVQHASQATSLGGYLASSTPEQTPHESDLSYSSRRENLLWHSWVLTESARRTWVVSSGVQAVFRAVQQKLVFPCQGGMMVTTRQGIWEAQSSLAWEKLCSEVDVGLVQVADIESLFTAVAPRDVNEFTKTILEVVFGKEKMERWDVQMDLL